MQRARVGINGFGRIGRLALRAAWGWPELEFTQINEVARDAAAAAHLLKFDSIHGRWGHDAQADGANVTIDSETIAYSAMPSPGAVPWDVDVVLECSGKFRTIDSLQPYFDSGVTKVIVAAPADGPLHGILGYETRPLVSVDYKDDPRSGVVDAPSTMW